MGSRVRMGRISEWDFFRNFVSDFCMGLIRYEFNLNDVMLK